MNYPTKLSVEELKKGKIWAVAHSHIDIAWLWEIEETRHQVCPETFNNVLTLMDKNPDFYFAQSSALMYEWMERDHPEIFEKIKKRVKEGRWEIVGGMWVEPDCNLPCGESLARQLLYGQRYFKEKFGIEVKIGWNPDTFGFCWTLPQIYKKCGVDKFLTSKLLWQGSFFPYRLFIWQSADGSQILGCQASEFTYGTEDLLLFSISRLIHLHRIYDLIHLYGRGDHGGGPTQQDIDHLRERKIPQLSFSTAQMYFDRITSLKENLPIVNDELYLGTHRGCYTSQAKTKLNNRKSEILMMNAEKFSVVAQSYGFKYPQEELEKAWKLVLTNQFHDILPGSSIRKVYEKADEDYKAIFEIGERILIEALKSIAIHIDTHGEGHSLIAFNPLSWSRDGLIEVDLHLIGNSDEVTILDKEGRIIPTQVVEERRRLIFIAEEVPAGGYKEYRIIPMKKDKLKTSVKVNEYNLENEFFKVSLDPKTGWLSKIYDKKNKREVLDDSKRGNLIQISEDDNFTETAWNIKYIGEFIDLGEATQIKIIEEGPVRVMIEVLHLYKQMGRPDSRFVQKICLYHRLPYLECKMKVDWYARLRTAKILFHLSFSNEEATYEIPYGTIKRRNHGLITNTGVERQKWEVSAQRWVDYSDGATDYGVSLINDCKYGFDVSENRLRMTILRSPVDPDPEADQGEHEFSYALYPHKGNWKEAKTVRKGYEFNYPLLYRIEPIHPGSLPKEHSFFEVKPENIILTVIKKAEDSAEIILRAYETAGEEVEAEITLSQLPQKAWETDMLERSSFELPITDRVIKALFKPYEIKTLKIRLIS